MKRVMCFCLAFLVPVAAAAQAARELPPERLSLDEAIRIAIAQNRSLKSALLQVEKAEQDVATARTHRLPAFSTDVTGSQLLTPVNFSFPRGAFGEFPGTGPIPATDTNVSVSRQPTMYVTSQASQPLSQLIRIGLGIRNAEAVRDIARERARAQQISIVNNVKRSYFAILQTESAVAASDEAIALYRELDRTLQVRVVEKVALRADALDVGYRLAQEQLARVSRKNTLASQKEQLNQLLGRDVRTAFEVDEASAVSLLEIDVDAAERRALANRPDIREAQLTLRQAELDRRLSKADRIPDISLAVSYSSNFNIDVLPRNLATVGVKVSWEPFDWGRNGREVAVKSKAVEQARLGIRDAEDRAVIEVRTRFRTLDEKRASVAVAQMAQATAREKLRVKTTQYQIQAALLTDVLQVRAELASADDRYQQALLAFWTAKADFELAVGEEVIR